MDPHSSSSASSSMSRRNYDAFLSFRGVDTRPTFISHLYRALDQKGVDTFKDNEELEAGQSRSELFNAIEGSSVAVVTFSENYAGSKWCLDELQKIMERKRQGKMVVIPIFYRVSPREVRLHEKENGEKGCYQIAMEEMETKYGRDSKTMKRWREALWEGGDLIGIELGIGKDEGDVIQDVVDMVMNTHGIGEYLEVAKHPIGIGRHLRAIRPSLHMDPHVDDVFMVGILGQGGVGKTTLSKAIYNDIANRFDDCCFLPNVRETTWRDFNGLAQLQQKLLRKLLGDKNLEVSSVDSGKQMIKHRLSKKRVLVILDDVEALVQLDALAGDLDWFGKGSRVILTTRNEHVLTANRVPIYKVNLLDWEEAENLFRLHAFGKQEKINIDCDLINTFAEYSGKLPLALVVLGAFLRGRSESEWKGKLKELKGIPDAAINKVLKISYDGLEEQYKGIFLDVACFFKGRDINEVEKILDGCGFSASLGLTILRERCLITIVDEEIEMHDLLVEMGQSIVRDKSNGIPNRIWLYEDFWKIMSDERERQGVEGIVLYGVRENDDRIINYNALKDFKKLKILIINSLNKVVFVEELLQLPRELRWLELAECSVLAMEFYPSSELVHLKLWMSKIQQIKAMGLAKLKYLELNGCPSLETLPDLSRCRDLEVLHLWECSNLTGLDEAVGSLENLVQLEVLNCRNLAMVPSSLRSKRLQTLYFRECTNLEKIPAIMEKQEFLKELYLWNVAVKELPDSIGNLVALKTLVLSGCNELMVIPSSIYKMQALKELLLEKCPKLSGFPRRAAGAATNSSDRHKLDSGYINIRLFLEGLEKLKLLCLHDCPSLETLPDLSRCRDLEVLDLSHCDSLTGLDEAIGSLENLVQLKLKYCRNLVMVSSSLRSKRLQTLYFSNCPNLKKIPAIMEKHEFLKELYLEKTAVKELPDTIGNLVSLKTLHLFDCNELMVIPSSIYNMQALKELRLGYCRKLSGFPRRAAGAATDVQGFPNLVSLDITDCQLKDVEFLDDLTCLETLTSLALSGNEFTHVPASISKLRNLQVLMLDRCFQLVEVSELPNIPDLNMAKCQGKKAFWADFSDSHKLDSGYIMNRWLSLENVRGSVGAISVVFPVLEFPNWVKFYSGEWDSCYRVCLPRDMLVDDLFGLALFFGLGSPPDQSFGFYRVRVNCVPIFEESIGGSNSWWVYIPCQSLIQGDGDFTSELNGLDITVDVVDLDVCPIRWGMRLVCKREEDEEGIKVFKDGDDNDVTIRDWKINLTKRMRKGVKPNDGEKQNGTTEDSILKNSFKFLGIKGICLTMFTTILVLFFLWNWIHEINE